MVSRCLSSFVCGLFMILLPAVWADHCSSYVDTSGIYHDPQQCGSWYCCGDCDKMYCCSGQEHRLSQEKQAGCHARISSNKHSNIAVIVGSIFASISTLIVCVVLIVCCVSPCCLFYKRCRKGRNQRQQIVISTTNVVNAPQQPLSPTGNQPSYPGYQPVPVLQGYGGPPIPTAPPHSYLESNDPSHTPVSSPQGQPMNSLQHPAHPYASLPYSDELAQPPYNPSYGPNP